MKQLSALFNLPFIGNLQTVPAEVTDFAPSDFAATIDIGVGRDEGVQLDMPVVGAGGLVGQVVQANHNTATVRLITDGQSSVGARYGPPADSSLAVLTGQGSGRPLTAGLVPNNTTLSAGEVFTTSGLRARATRPASRWPRSSAPKTGATASQESVTLEPLADLVHLRYVAVVLWGPSS